MPCGNDTVSFNIPVTSATMFERDNRKGGDRAIDDRAGAGQAFLETGQSRAAGFDEEGRSPAPADAPLQRRSPAAAPGDPRDPPGLAAPPSACDGAGAVVSVAGARGRIPLLGR